MITSLAKWPTMNSEPLYSCIKKQIMKEKHCMFECCKVLLSINNDKPPGIENRWNPTEYGS